MEGTHEQVLNYYRSLSFKDIDRKEKELWEIVWDNYITHQEAEIEEVLEHSPEELAEEWRIASKVRFEKRLAKNKTKQKPSRKYFKE